MPELPDITVYIERLGHFLNGKRLRRARVASPFLLRTFDPKLSSIEGRAIVGFSRLGKRIVFHFDQDLFAVLHLMISGRLWWKKVDVALPKKRGLAAFDFEHGSLLLTEASTQKRASLHLFEGESGVLALDRGGLEPLAVDLERFAKRLQLENRTLKRALTDPRIFSGIGNAYSDEILHAAGQSPVALTSRLDEDAIARLHRATQEILTLWIRRTRDEVGDGFPENVTAFRQRMAVHGRYKQPCPRCGSAIQRIRYAANEVNYCPTCQTGGKLLADRGLSRLLQKDWPKTPEELEEMKTERSDG